MSAFGRRNHDGVVDLIEHAHRTVSAANAPDAVDRTIRGEAVEIGESMFVAAGEISGALEHVVADDRLPAHSARVVACELEVGFIAKRAGGRDESDA